MPEERKLDIFTSSLQCTVLSVAAYAYYLLLFVTKAFLYSAPPDLKFSSILSGGNVSDSLNFVGGLYNYTYRFTTTLCSLQLCIMLVFSEEKRAECI